MVAASAFSIRVAKLCDSGPVVAVGEGVWSGVCMSMMVLPPGCMPVGRII